MVVKINLLPPYIVKERRKKFITKVGSCALILIVVVIAIRGSILYFQLSDLKKRIKKEEEKIIELKPQVEQLRAYEEELKKMKERVDVVNQLQRGRFIWTRFLDVFIKALPHGIWIHELKPTAQASGYTIAISATALDNFTIAQFMINLIGIDAFSNIILDQITRDQVEGREVRKFTLSWFFTPWQE